MLYQQHSSDYDLAPVKGLWYREPDYAPSATGHSELQPSRVQQSAARCHLSQLTSVFQKTTENFSFLELISLALILF